MHFGCGIVGKRSGNMLLSNQLVVYSFSGGKVSDRKIEIRAIYPRIFSGSHL